MLQHCRAVLQHVATSLSTCSYERLVDWRSFAVGFLLFELSLNFEGLAFSLWVSQTLPRLARLCLQAPPTRLRT